jgi:chemotaxis protein MotB
MKGRRQDAPVNHDRWLVSYADFVTLLFAFFVVLYATAQVDKQKAIRLSDAIRSAFQDLGMFQKGPQRALPGPSGLPAVPAPGAPATPVPPPPSAAGRQEDWNAIRAELERALADEIRRNEVALHMDAEGLVVSLREIGFFDSGSATIKPAAEDAFGRVAGILHQHACAVRVEGHTDNVPIHTAQFASNWELSTARATGLVKSLIEQYEIFPGRLSAAGFAEFHPVSANDSSKGRQLNRRVDVVLLKNSRPHGSATDGLPTGGSG